MHHKHQMTMLAGDDLQIAAAIVDIPTHPCTTWISATISFRHPSYMQTVDVPLIQRHPCMSQDDKKSEARTTQAQSSLLQQRRNDEACAQLNTAECRLTRINNATQVEPITRTPT